MSIIDFLEVKIEVYIPPEYVDALRDALNQAGAGRIGDYDHCISVTNVTGYWRPLADAKPFAGEIGAISKGSECKVEVRCRTSIVEAVLKAILEVHPYEEPVYNIVPLLNSLFQ